MCSSTAKREATQSVTPAVSAILKATRVIRVLTFVKGKRLAEPQRDSVVPAESWRVGAGGHGHSYLRHPADEFGRGRSLLQEAYGSNLLRQCRRPQKRRPGHAGR